MRHSGKGTDAAPLANFLLVGALLIAGNVFWGLAASWHSIAMGIPAVVSLIMVVLLVVTDKAGEDSTSIAKEHIAAPGNVGAKTTRLYEAIHCPSKESRSPKWANEVRWRRMLAKSTGTAQLHRCGFYFASTITHDLCFLDRAASSPCPSRGHFASPRSIQSTRKIPPRLCHARKLFASA